MTGVRLLCGGTWGLWQSPYFLVRERFRRGPSLLPRNPSIGFRAHLGYRVPR